VEPHAQLKGLSASQYHPAMAAPRLERIRPCLRCGVILRLDQDPCPQCGARARGEDDDRVKPCAHCGAILPFEQLYCGECHELSIPIETDQIPPDVELVDRGRASERVPALLGGLAFAIGIATLLVAAVEIAR
jgi:RNA polymerase subunit RPABC4/transcription elongation factor Spt4